jgi:hypothetical protein
VALEQTNERPERMARVADRERAARGHGAQRDAAQLASASARRVAANSSPTSTSTSSIA